MNKAQLSAAIGEVDSCYVREAMLTHTITPKSKRMFRVGLMAAVVTGLLIIAAGAVCLVTPVLQSYFGDTAQYVYQKNSQILNLSQTIDGWTLTLTDCIGDDQRLYIGMEVTAPEGTVLNGTGGSAAGLGVKDIEKGFNLPYDFSKYEITVEDGTEGPIAWYVSQVPDESEEDNHLRFALWVNCREPLDGKIISLTVSKIFHAGSPRDGTAVYDFDGTWTFQNIRLDLADQTIRLEPNVTVPILDTTAVLTKLTVSPVSVMVCFEGKGLIGQNQRYPNGTNIEDPTITLYDKDGNVIELETQYAPFGSRGGSDEDNETGTLKIVQNYEAFIDMDALDHIEICGVVISLK